MMSKADALLQQHHGASILTVLWSRFQTYEFVLYQLS